MKDDVFVEESPVIRHEDYQTERNKPMPNKIHGALQSAINYLLISKYGHQFLFPNELSLETVPGSTPDICVYPKKKLDIKVVEAKEKEPPITAIEIISPSQTFNEIMHKAWDLYFPMGVKSVWIVVPEVKAIHVLMPDDQNLYFSSGNLKDPATGIEISIEKVFEDLL